MDGIAYIPGDEPSRAAPLSRYLPVIPEGVAAAFLERHFGPVENDGGAWILDPLGASPHLDMEMAAHGHRLLVSVNNPVTRFLLEMGANPPSQVDLRAALAELAAARKGTERLESHLQSLYLTTCTKCQRQVPAEAFVWERGGEAPVARIYHCTCGDDGEYAVTDADRERAASIAATDGMHRSRALERVAAPGDPDRIHAEEALECYLPRAVYALITIINKLDAIDLNEQRKQALFALVLTACDEASVLWPHPAERPRPRQLTPPPRFLEKNVWMALERGIDLWAGDRKSTPLTNWPTPPGDGGGICLFDGPIRNLAPHLKNLSIGAVVTAFPRPNQAFWTLSALWAGWLWGQEAAAPFKAVVRRRRYDWNWHAAALYAAMKNFADRLPLNTPLFAILPEVEPAFLSAVLLATAGAGFELSGLALRTSHDAAQLICHRRAFIREEKEVNPIDAGEVLQAMRQLLGERGEPVPYLFLHAAALTAMAAQHCLHWQVDALAQIHAPIQAALASEDFIHYTESPNPESGLWGLTKWDADGESLPDRLEVMVVQFLQKNPGCTWKEIEFAINSGFPGLLTPSRGLLHAILASSAVETAGQWNLRTEDTPAARRADLESAAQSLTLLGKQIGYSLQREEKPWRVVRWLEDGRVIYSFSLLASAMAGRLLRQEKDGAANSVLVLPGGRAGLLTYKLDRDPSLRSLAERWRIVKFRQLRRLAGMHGLDRDQINKEFSTDPIEPPEQMKMF